MTPECPPDPHLIADTSDITAHAAVTVDLMVQE